ncbi:hypothetical protein LTR65_003236 [Meristemomyces frigidus]
MATAWIHLQSAHNSPLPGQEGAQHTEQEDAAEQAGTDGASFAAPSTVAQATGHEYAGQSVPLSRDRPEVKLAVCDHCRAHGLPCDESGVCEQCILHEVACIHHWCKLSRESESDCPRRSSRYVHEDAMSDLRGEWLVLPGKVSEYRSKQSLSMKKGWAITRTHGREELDRRYGPLWLASKRRSR